MKSFLLFILLSTGVIFAKDITISTGEWSPWVSLSLKHKGVASHITSEAFKTQGYGTKFNFYPWKRAYVTAKLAKDDASGFWLRTKERSDDFYFSDKIFTIKNKLVFKKGKNIEFNSVNDLKNYKIAVTRGYSYSQKIDDMIKNKELDIHVVNSDLAGLKQTLKKDLFDAFLCSESVAKTLIMDNFSKEDGKKLIFYKKAVFEKPIFLMVSKKHKEHRKILGVFNRGLKELRKRSLITKMIEDSYSGKYK